jgi:hypothetical protein
MKKILVAFSDCEAGFFVLTAGSNYGVKKGRIFSVKEGEPVEIYDPITKEHLDTIEREKAQLIVREVKPKLSICTGYVHDMAKEEIGWMQDGLVNVGDGAKQI